MNNRRSLSLLSRACLVVGGTHGLVGVAMVSTSAEGWLGGLLYAVIYALPMLGIGLLVGSDQELRFRVGGWLSLLLAGGYAAVVLGNWTAYGPDDAVFAMAVTVPTVVLYLLVFWRAGVSDVHGDHGVRTQAHRLLPRHR